MVYKPVLENSSSAAVLTLNFGRLIVHLTFFTIHSPCLKPSLRSVLTLQWKIFLFNKINFPYICVNQT